MFPGTYIKIIKTINLINPDVIHIALPFLWIAMVLPFLKKYPTVVTEHNPILHSGTHIIIRIYMIFSTWFTRKNVDAIIVHGQRMKEIVIQAGVEENKIWIMKHGEFSYYKKWERPEVKEDRCILFFGGISKYKGIKYFVQAAKLVVAQEQDITFIIAGQGDLDKYLPLKDRPDYFKIYNSYIPDEDVAFFFQQAAIVVLPYIDGTQSGVIPVAFSFGKPVIATDVGSIPEEIDDGKTGIIIPPNNSDALASAIIKLINNRKLRENMGNNTLVKVKSELSWDRIALETIELYKTIVTNNTHK
jgi:glycosyltransferase involved in cell wall biosynthesis